MCLLFAATALKLDDDSDGDYEVPDHGDESGPMLTKKQLDNYMYKPCSPEYHHPDVSRGDDGGEYVEPQLSLSERKPRAHDDYVYMKGSPERNADVCCGDDHWDYVEPENEYVEPENEYVFAADKANQQCNQAVTNLSSTSQGSLEDFVDMQEMASAVNGDLTEAVQPVTQRGGQVVFDPDSMTTNQLYVRGSQKISDPDSMEINRLYVRGGQKISDPDSMEINKLYVSHAQEISDPDLKSHEPTSRAGEQVKHLTRIPSFERGDRFGQSGETQPPVCKCSPGASSTEPLFLQGHSQVQKGTRGLPTQRPVASSGSGMAAHSINVSSSRSTEYDYVSQRHFMQLNDPHPEGHGLSTGSQFTRPRPLARHRSHDGNDCAPMSLNSRLRDQQADETADKAHYHSLIRQGNVYKNEQADGTPQQGRDFGPSMPPVPRPRHIDLAGNYSHLQSRDESSPQETAVQSPTRATTGYETTPPAKPVKKKRSTLGRAVSESQLQSRRQSDRPQTRASLRALSAAENEAKAKELSGKLPFLNLADAMCELKKYDWNMQEAETRITTDTVLDVFKTIRGMGLHDDDDLDYAACEFALKRYEWNKEQAIQALIQRRHM